MERIYKEEFHEHSFRIFKDATGTELIHWEDEVYFDSLGELLWKICTGGLGEKSNGFRTMLNTKLLRGMWLNMYNPIWMETILMKFCEQSEKKETDENSYLERASRIQGMTPRKICTEGLVLIACPDRSRWGDSTEEQEEIDGEHSECVHEIVPMQDIDE